MQVSDLDSADINFGYNSIVCSVLLGQMRVWRKRLRTWMCGVEQPNESQPIPGPKPDGSLCIYGLFQDEESQPTGLFIRSGQMFC